MSYFKVTKPAKSVPAKMKVVVEELLTQHVFDLAAAAEKAGITTYWAKRYLQQPNVLHYFREQRAARIEQVCAGNAAALAKVRAESDNGMAITAACRQLEIMRQTVAEESGAVQRPRPGLQIVIHTPGGNTQVLCGPAERPAPLIDVTPEAAPVEEG